MPVHTPRGRVTRVPQQHPTSQFAFLCPMPIQLYPCLVPGGVQGTSPPCVFMVTLRDRRAAEDAAVQRGFTKGTQPGASSRGRAGTRPQHGLDRCCRNLRLPGVRNLLCLLLARALSRAQQVKRDTPWLSQAQSSASALSLLSGVPAGGSWEQEVGRPHRKRGKGRGLSLGGVGDRQVARASVNALPVPCSAAWCLGVQGLRTGAVWGGGPVGVAGREGAAQLTAGDGAQAAAAATKERSEGNEAWQPLSQLLWV